jgi:hypothetical protein
MNNVIELPSEMVVATSAVAAIGRLTSQAGDILPHYFFTLYLSSGTEIYWKVWPVDGGDLTPGDGKRAEAIRDRVVHDWKTHLANP